MYILILAYLQISKNNHIHHKINSAQDKVLNDINLAIDESIQEFSNLLLEKIDTSTDVGENKQNEGKTKWQNKTKNGISYHAIQNKK